VPTVLPVPPVVLELPEVWPGTLPLLEVPLVLEPACAAILTAQPSTIAKVAPVHSLFIRILPMNTSGRLCNHNAIYVMAAYIHTPAAAVGA